MNNGFVDTPKPKEPTFNLSNAIYVAKQQEATKSKNVSRPQQMDKPKKSYQWRVYTKLAEPYDVILKTLVANNYLTLLANSCSFDPLIKPDWWKEDHFCNYH